MSGLIAHIEWILWLKVASSSKSRPLSPCADFRHAFTVLRVTRVRANGRTNSGRGARSTPRAVVRCSWCIRKRSGLWGRRWHASTGESNLLACRRTRWSSVGDDATGEPATSRGNCEANCLGRRWFSHVRLVLNSPLRRFSRPKAGEEVGRRSAALTCYE